MAGGLYLYSLLTMARAGVLNGNADGLSRQSWTTMEEEIPSFAAKEGGRDVGVLPQPELAQLQSATALEHSHYMRINISKQVKLLSHLYHSFLAKKSLTSHFSFSPSPVL